MNAAAIHILKERLATDGHFKGAVNGQRDTATDAAAHAFILARRAALSSDPAGWSARRRTVAAYQLVLADEGMEPGPADGLWGPMTDSAHEALLEKREFGAPILFRDIPPADANPHGWPTDDAGQAGLRAFYGPPGQQNGHTPPLRMVDCPWRLRLAWNLSSGTRRIGCHEKVADSLERVLKRVFEHYGLEEIRRLRLDVYGGCYAPRRKRGGSTWSTHAWAMALDFDPDNNKLRWGRDRASFARPEYDAWWGFWEEEGWVSLGRARNFDWMHVQAARL